MLTPSRTFALTVLLIAGSLWVRSASAVVILETAVNPNNGHTYLLLDNSTWLNAEATAVSLGGHLVTINDATEQNWLNAKWGGSRTLLIGLTDAGHEGTFTWTSGEPFNYSHWAPGEPNNGVGYGTGPENYAYIYRDGTGHSGYWNDYTGQSVLDQLPMNGVVELVPEPSSLTLLVFAGLGLSGLCRRSA